MSHNIHISKNGKTLVAIDNFDLQPGKMTFLFGESGIGKSLLSKAIYGLIDPHSLDVTIDGMPYRDYLADDGVIAAKRNGFFVFQEPSSHLNPLRTLETQINEGSLSGKSGEAEALEKLWEGKADAAVQQILRVFPKPYRPSGGEKQRILLAMAFKKIAKFQQDGAPENHLFVFDEPTGSLDNRYRNIFLKLLLDKFKETPFTSIFITHDYSIISEVAGYPKQLQSQIIYKELTESNNGLQLRDFAAKEYLNWIDEEKHADFAGTSSAKTVFSIDSGYRVFEKTMQFKKAKSQQKTDDLVIRSGEMAYVKAASGIGKTTLAKIIMGLQPAENLAFSLSGEDFSEQTQPGKWRKKVWGKSAGMVFQHADESLNLQASVREIFAGLPLEKPLNDDSLSEHLRSIFDIAIDDAFLSKRTGLLSGGQKQRLNLLRTLLLNTDLLIFDEPFNGLDLESIQKIVALIKYKLADGAAILMISHNEEIVESIVPPERIYFLTAES